MVVLPSTAPKLTLSPSTVPETLPAERQSDPATPIAPTTRLPCWAHVSVNVPVAVFGVALIQVPFQAPVRLPSAPAEVGDGVAVGVAVGASVIVRTGVGDGVDDGDDWACACGETTVPQPATEKTTTAASAHLRTRPTMVVTLLFIDGPEVLCGLL
jgi:hypothetical protein